MKLKNGKRTESHRTKSHKTPRTKSHRTKSHNLYYLLWLTKSHRTKIHNIYVCLTCMQIGQEVTIYIYIYLDSCTCVGRTKCHNMYTPRFMYVYRQDRKSLCDICYFSSTRYSKHPRYFKMKNNKSFILISLCQTVKTGFFVLDLQVIV